MTGKKFENLGKHCCEWPAGKASAEVQKFVEANSKPHDTVIYMDGSVTMNRSGWGCTVEQGRRTALEDNGAHRVITFCLTMEADEVTCLIPCLASQHDSPITDLIKDLTLKAARHWAVNLILRIVFDLHWARQPMLLYKWQWRSPVVCCTVDGLSHVSVRSSSQLTKASGYLSLQSKDSYLCSFWSIWVTYGFMQSVEFVQHVRPSCMTKALTLDITSKFFKEILLCHSLKHRRLVPFYTTFCDLDIGWRLQSQQSTVGWLSFLHTFQVTGMKLDMGMKRFKLNILKLFFNELLRVQGNYCRFAHCI